MKPLDLPIRKRLKKNYHLCENCGREYYRRTGNDPKRITRFCNRDCMSAPKSPKIEAVADAPSATDSNLSPASRKAAKTKRLSSFIPTPIAADLVGYSRDHVAELARSGQIAATKGTGKNDRWHVSLPSLEQYAQKQLFPVSRVAKFVGYSTSQVRRLASAGKVEATKEGRNWYVSVDSMRQYVLSQYSAAA